MSIMACIGWFALGILVGQIILILIAVVLKEGKEDGKNKNNQSKQ
jgi:hypothetical protein